MAKTPSPAYEFVAAVLTRNPAATFHEVKRLGADQGLVVYPVVYGRAKAVLGLVPVVGQPGHGQPVRSAVEPSGRAGVDDDAASRSVVFESFVEQIRELRRQRDEAVEMLERIRELFQGIVEESEQD